MSKVSLHQLRKFSDALALLYSPANLRHFPERVLSASRELFPAELVNYNEFGASHYVTVNSDAAADGYDEVFIAHGHEHPSWELAHQHGFFQPVKISDFLSDRQWQSTNLYRECFGKLGLDYQLAGMVPMGKRQIGCVMNRGTKDFTEEDRMLLQMFVSHVPNAFQNAQFHSAVESSAAPFRFEELQCVLVDRDGSFRESAQSGLELLSRYFGPCRKSLNKVPLHWFRTQLDQMEREPGSKPVPLHARGDNGDLTVWFAPAAGDGTFYLWCKETTHTAVWQRYRPLGLTEREAQILFWIAQGKRNAEIAGIIGAAPRTVSKHVENILRKLNVETRAAAASIATQWAG